jgi:Zn-dependent protease
MIFNLNKFRLCEVFGIPLYVDISFAILLLFFAFSSSSFLGGILMAVLLAFSVVMHECGHSLVARAFGYETRDITISLLGGCASLTALPRKAYQELLTAAAGPAVSFIIAALSYMVIIFSGFGDFFLYQFYVLFVMNMMLGTFNLLPALPMDGGRIFKSFLRLFMPKIKATRIAMYVGRALAVAIVVLPMLGIHHIGIFPLGGSWIRFLIAYMIWVESMREYEMACYENSFTSWRQNDFRARVSPPPYGDD